MFTKKILGGMFLVLVVSLNCVMATSRESTVVVVPARYKVMQVAFDIVTLRGVNLISYQKVPGSNDFLLHAWNPAGNVWEEVTPADLQGGVLNTVATAVIGTDGKQFIDYVGRSWGGAVKLLPTFDIATILTGLDACYHFKPYEWEWLARRYGISVKDVNYEKRRYGKYGPPGKARKPESVAPSSYQNRTIQSEDVETVSPLLDEVEVIEIVPPTKPVHKHSSSAIKKERTATDNRMIRLHELLPEK